MPVCILFSFRSQNVCVMYRTLSCGSICVKVSQLHSLWGRNRDDYGRTNREGRENKHWKHGHEQNSAGVGAEPRRRHLWDCGDPRVTKWRLTPQQLFIKADRLGGDGWRSIYAGR